MPALPPQTCWVVCCQPSKGQINKSTSTLDHRLFHRTTSCFENPSSRWWTSQCARKTKKWHWECERSSSWKVPTNSCHLANCNCCAHLVIQLHVELWPSHHISMLDNPVWCLVMKQEVQIHRDLVVWWKSNTQPFVICLERTKGSGHGHYRSFGTLDSEVYKMISQQDMTKNYRIMTRHDVGVMPTITGFDMQNRKFLLNLGSPQPLVSLDGVPI